MSACTASLMVLVLWTCGAAVSEVPLAATADDDIPPAAARQAATPNGTVPRRHSESSGSGKVLFPDQQSQRAEEEVQGRHAVSPPRPWQSGLLIGTAEPHRPAIPRSSCQLYPDAGPCSGHVAAWYWDSAEESCKTFLYGGCKGNANNFITHDECRAVCDIGYIQKVTGSSQLLPRPDAAKHHRYPESGEYFSPVTGGGHYQPRPDDYPPRPDSEAHPKYPSYAGTNDYPSYPASSSQHSYRDPGTYPSSPSEYPGDRPHPGTYPSLFGPGGGAGQAHLQEIGEVDITGLVSPPAGHGLLPDRPAGCPASEPICDYHHSGYPRSTVDSIVSRYTSELRQMYQQLYHHPPERFARHGNGTEDDLRSRSAADSVSARHGPGEFVCESEVQYSRPGWARTFSGLWQLVINTAALPQAVRVERCRYEGRRCNFLAPCMSSVCVQRFAVVKMLCADPLNPFVRPRVQDVRIPSGCSCYVTGAPSELWREPWVRSDSDTNTEHSARRDE